MRVQLIHRIQLHQRLEHQQLDYDRIFVSVPTRSRRSEKLP